MAAIQSSGKHTVPTQIGRFAPSITGSAHPGTLLSALLVWLDIRSRNGRVLLRLEDLDRTRLRPGQLDQMLHALSWLGLDWDQTIVQSEQFAAHQAALDTLAADGVLYSCICGRKERQQRLAGGPPGCLYDNLCQSRPLRGNWRDCTTALRARLPPQRVVLADESGLDLSQIPAQNPGDPIVRRRDGIVCYHLAVVVDDAASGVTRVIRGRDLATSTATQIHLQSMLDLPHPSYCHHMLLQENSGQKLSKFHGSMPFGVLQRNFSGPQMCGHLAHWAGLRPDSTPCNPVDLVASFAWNRVCTNDKLYPK